MRHVQRPGDVVELTESYYNLYPTFDPNVDDMISNVRHKTEEPPFAFIVCSVRFLRDSASSLSQFISLAITPDYVGWLN